MAPMKSYKAKGIVLHTVKYGENSMVLYLLTDVGGRRTYMVSGAAGGRKRRSGRISLFQPMFVLEFEGLESGKMQMHRMKEVKCGLVTKTLATDIRKSTISLFMAETIYRLVKETEQNMPLFEFLFKSIETLDSLDRGVANFHLWFLVRMSSLLGFYPSNEYTESCWFDIQEGGFTPIRPKHRMIFDRDSSRLLGIFMDCTQAELENIQLSRERRNKFLQDVFLYFSYHLDNIGEVRSLRILKEVF